MEKPGVRLKKIRNEKGLNQTEFASLIGIAQTTLSELENKKTRINEVTLNAIEYKTGAKKEWIKTGKGGKYLYYGSEKSEGRVSDIAFDKDLYRVTKALNKIPFKLRSNVSRQVLAFIDLLSKNLRKR